MITMMIRINPRDMAPSRRDGRRGKPRRSVGPAKHNRGPGAKPEPGGAYCALSRLHVRRRRIDAIAQARRSGAVIEDMAEMAAAFRAQYFGADHAVAGVALLVDMAPPRAPGGQRRRPPRHAC